MQKWHAPVQPSARTRKTYIDLTSLYHGLEILDVRKRSKGSFDGWLKSAPTIQMASVAQVWVHKANVQIAAVIELDQSVKIKGVIKTVNIRATIN